jgi:imidazolonepropionase
MEDYGMDLLIENLAEIATPRGNQSRRGAEQGKVLRLARGEVLCRQGRIDFVGSREERLTGYGELPEVRRLDGRGGTLIPGFVDPHTHLPWTGSREEEFAMRLSGKSYMDIAAAGGGILSTVRATRSASEEELVIRVRERLDRMLRHGTTTAEAKSGYGLNLPDELKQLRAIRLGSEQHAVDLVPTLLAAHETPPEYRDRRQVYVDVVCREIIPAVADAGLAAFCDIFCEEGVFTAAESRRVLEAGRHHGMAPRIHADEFVDSGGAELAAELGAFSADHLIAISCSTTDRRRNPGGHRHRLQSGFLQHRVHADGRRAGSL